MFTTEGLEIARAAVRPLLLKKALAGRRETCGGILVFVLIYVFCGRTKINAVFLGVLFDFGIYVLSPPKSVQLLAEMFAHWLLIAAENFRTFVKYCVSGTRFSWRNANVAHTHAS